VKVVKRRLEAVRTESTRERTTGTFAGDEETRGGTCVRERSEGGSDGLVCRVAFPSLASVTLSDGTKKYLRSA